MPDHALTRHRRRTLADIVVVGHLLMIAGAVLFKQPTLVLSVWLTGSGLIVGVGGAVVLRKLTGRVTTASSELDERETELRNRAHHTGFQLLSSLVLIDLLYGLYAAAQPDSGSLAAAMTAALFLLGTSTPALVLAWTLPDDDPEDFAEEGVHHA